MENLEARTIIDEWNEDHGHRKDEGDSLFIKRLRPFLGEEQIAQVLITMGEVCNECWDDEEPCTCIWDWD